MPIYGFDTENEHAATAALAFYGVYRSRDRSGDGPDMWSRFERFLKDAAGRAKNIQQMVENLKAPGRLYAPTIQPRFLEVGLAGEIPLVHYHNPDGTFSHAIRFNRDRDTGAREFGVAVFGRADHRAVLDVAYRETWWVMALVRERLDRERPIENQLYEMHDEAEQAEP